MGAIYLYDIEQGTDEWIHARLGRVTASHFGDVLAGGAGKTRTSYLRKLVAERLTGVPNPGYSNAAMQRGKELEPGARSLYATLKGVEVAEVGLVLDDDLMVAGSPDGLIDEDGGLEIKSVYPTTQLDTWLADAVPSEHIPQIQGNLWVCERGWWDFVSYCPEMPAHLQLFVKRVYRDEDYINKLGMKTCDFLTEVDELVSKMMALHV